MSIISFITICKWGLSYFSWYIVIFQLISLFMEYKLIQMYDLINTFWNKYRDIEFPLINFKLSPLVKVQALWLCFDTAYSSYSGIFQSNKKNHNAGNLTKLILSKLIKVNLYTWNYIVRKHPTMIVEIKTLSRRAIDFIEDVIQFLFAILRMYISVYYSKNYIIIAYCLILALVSLFSLFSFKNRIENDKKIFSNKIQAITEEKEYSLALIQENIRTSNFSPVVNSLNALVDKLVNAQNASNFNQQYKTFTTHMLNRVLFCFIRWCFIMYFTNGMTTKDVHRQYILLTIGSHSSNEIVNRMNRLINAIMNAEKDCHRVLDSLNHAITMKEPNRIKINTDNLNIINYKFVLGKHTCLAKNIKLDKGVNYLQGNNGSGKTVFLKSLSGILNPQDIKEVKINQLNKQNFNSFYSKCFYLSDQTPDFIDTDWWLNKSNIYYELLFPDNLDESLFSNRILNLKNLNKAMAAKICLLKVFSQNYDFIFLDEIDSNFDELSQTHFLSLLETINKEKNNVIICVSHNIDKGTLICTKGKITKN